MEESWLEQEEWWYLGVSNSQSHYQHEAQKYKGKKHMKESEERAGGQARSVGAATHTHDSQLVAEKTGVQLSPFPI